MNNGTGLRRFVATSTATAPPRSAPSIMAAGSAPESISPARADLALPEPAAQERCELCATDIPDSHGHLADLERSSLVCACRACYLLFTRADAGGRYRAVPDRYLSDPAHPLEPGEWDSLDIPVALAFFLRSSRDNTVTCFYPSPAGATECKLDLDSWDRLATSYPLLGAVEPDVEAVLISRAGSGIECYGVPIDACYELAGRMRLHWRGFDGGSEARESIAEFLNIVRDRARSLDSES